jgi:hypothetical protein
VTLGANPTTVTVTVSTKAPAARNASLLLHSMWLPLGGIILICVGRKRVTGMLASLLFLSMLPGCGGTSSNAPAPNPPPTAGTPAGTYTLTVSADSGMLHHATTLTLVVQ